MRFRRLLNICRVSATTELDFATIARMLGLDLGLEADFMALTLKALALALALRCGRDVGLMWQAKATAKAVSSGRRS